MLIYLNRTGFNGLFRLNSKGGYNVPPGRYDRPRIVDRPLLTEVSQILSRPHVHIEHGSFDRVLAVACAGDFVYFDPPYAPLTPTANFRHYTGRGFETRDQEHLQRVVIALAARGVQVLLSNSTAPEVTGGMRAQPGGAPPASRLALPARRAINLGQSDADGR